jgi:chromosome segregation ATPase
MRLDDLPDAFKDFVDRADAVLRWEAEKVKKAVAALNAEKATAQKALTELQDQHKATQKQLEEVVSNLDKGTTLAGINSKIAEARKTLDALTTDIAMAETALAKSVTERGVAERQRDEANDGMQWLRQERANAVAEIDRIEALVKSFGRAA